MTDDKDRSTRWSKLDWGKAIASGILAWVLISYLIEPFLAYVVSRSIETYQWFSDNMFATSLMVAKGGTDFVLLVLIMLFFTILSLVTVGLATFLTWVSVKSEESDDKQTRRSILFRLLSNPISANKTARLPMYWVLVVVIILSLVYLTLPFINGFGLRIYFENAMHRLAPHVSTSDIKEFESRWWGLSDKQSYQEFAESVNKLAIEKCVLIGNPLSADYSPIIEVSESCN